MASERVKSGTNRVNDRQVHQRIHFYLHVVQWVDFRRARHADRGLLEDIHAAEGALVVHHDHRGGDREGLEVRRFEAGMGDHAHRLVEENGA